VGRRVILIVVLAGACALGAAGVRGGPEGGPKDLRCAIKPFSANLEPFPALSQGVRFKGGERARVVVVTARGETDVDLYIYDGDGNLVAWDDRPLDACSVEWLPERADRYAVEIRNAGPAVGEIEIQIR